MRTVNLSLVLVLLTGCSVDERTPEAPPVVGPSSQPSELAALWEGLVFDGGRVRPAVPNGTRSRRDAERLAAEGRRALDAGRAATAVAAFAEAVLAAPDAPEAYVGLGQALLLVRERDKAEAALRTALALDPENPDAHDRLAALLELRGRRREAVAHFEAALAKGGERPAAHLRLAVAYAYLGESDRARSHLEAARAAGLAIPAALPALLAGEGPPRARVRTAEALSAGERVRIDPGGGTAMAAETAISVHPGSPFEIVAAWNDLRESPVDGFWRLGAGVSIDGGETWSDFVVRPPAGFERPHEGDPMTARDPRTGTLWIGGTAFFQSIFVARKDPGSASFETPVIAHSGPTVDKGWLAAGPLPGVPASTRLYLAHNEGFQLSNDLGATWSALLPLGSVIFPLPRVTAGGEVYVSSWEAFGDEIWLHRSFDGGASLDGPRLVATRMDVWDTQAQDHTPGQYRVAPLPVFAVDPNDATLYCVYPDTSGVDGIEYDVDLYFTRSDDKGLTWSPPMVVHGDSDPPADQFFPWLEVDATGRLHLAFFDTRRFPQSDGDASGLIDVDYAFSDDRGDSWTERRVTSNPIDTSLAVWPVMGQFLGDYLGLSVAGDQVWLIYPATDNGDLDIFVERVTADAIFADGFESGNVAAWTWSVP